MLVPPPDRTRPRWSRRRRRFMIGTLVIFAVSLPWLALVPGAIWRGVGVIERCDDAIGREFDDSTYLAQGQERVRWFPPSWRCPATNGQVVHIGPLP